MIKSADFSGSVDTIPYKFRHYVISEFSLYVIGKRVPSEGHTLVLDHGKSYVMGYRTLLEGSSIHHSNTGLQITHDIYINGLFMLLFDLIPDRGSSKAHTSLPKNGNIRIELQFTFPLPESITWLLYLEYDSTVVVNFSRKFTTDF
jgi:hypothetical protein